MLLTSKHTAQEQPLCPFQVAIFFGAVVRADLNKIRIGYNTVIMDRAVIHASR